MKGKVWGLTFQDASTKLDQIEASYELYKTAKLVKKIKTKHTHYLIYDNGDEWNASSASESSRGSICNISYIDVRIDDGFVHHIIHNCTRRGPYQGFKYFYDFVESEE